MAVLSTVNINEMLISGEGKTSTTPPLTTKSKENATIF
jgi:hypothetical protein